MKFRLISVAIVCVSALLGPVSSGAQTQSAATASDEEAIRKVIVEMTERFNAHDAKASTVMYTADADLVTVRGTLSTTKRQTLSRQRSEQIWSG